MRRLRGLGIALAIAAAIELSVRPFAPVDRPARFVNEESGWAKAGVYYETDPDLFWVLRPSRDVVGGLYHTNAWGLRGREVTLPRPEGVFRVVMIGDSCTFGLGLDLPDTVGALIEGLDGPRGQRVEVVRLAVPGYSSLQSRVLAERWLPRLQPDAVVLYVGAFNDAAPACGASDAAQERAARLGDLRALLSRLAVYRMLGAWLRGPAPACPPRGPHPAPRVSRADFDRNVAELDRLARGAVSVERAGRPRVVWLAPPLVPGARAAPYRRAIAGRPGALAPVLARSDFQADAIHPNRSGNVALARALAGPLGLRGAIPREVVSDARAADDAEAAAALAILRTLATRHPDRPRLAIAAVRAALAADPGAALPEAREAVGRHPGVTELRRLLAEALAATGDAAGAEREVREGLQRDRGWVYGHVVLARTLAARGDREGARAAARSGLQVAPTSHELQRLVR